MDLKDYKWLRDYGVGLPVLILSIAIDDKPIEREFDFKKDRDWLKIFHQTAGHACHHVYLIGTILQPKGEVENIMKLISQNWLWSDCGAFGKTLDEVVEYREQTNDLLDVDCNLTYRWLEEGIYPIDCSHENLQKLCSDDFPKELDDLVNWGSVMDKAMGSVGRWKIFILGENCD